MIFSLTIKNTAPYFTNDKPKDLSIKMNDKYTMNLPQYVDDEGHPVIIIVKPDECLSYVTIN